MALKEQQPSNEAEKENSDQLNRSPGTADKRIKQGLKGGFKMALGVGLIATVAVGDAPGGALGAALVASAALGGAVTEVSGTMDVAGAAANVDVSKGQEFLDATGNFAGLSATAVSGGNLKVGQATTTISDVVTLGTSPREAYRNAATLADSARTIMGTGELIRSQWSNIKSAISSELQAFRPIFF